MKNKAYNTIKNRIMEQRKSLEDLTNIADLDFAITELNEIDGMIKLAQVLQVNQDLIDELKNEVATNFDIILKKLKANEILVHDKTDLLIKVKIISNMEGDCFVHPLYYIDIQKGVTFSVRPCIKRYIGKTRYNRLIPHQ